MNKKYFSNKKITQENVFPFEKSQIMMTLNIIL